MSGDRALALPRVEGARVRRRRVPLVLQTDGVGCGAACLAMVLRAHEIPATLADCRRQLSPGQRGVNALRLSQAAAKFGLRARVFSAAGREAVGQLPLPAVLHWGGEHFVVLESRSSRRDEVSILDPALGRRKLPWAEFLQHYSAVALVFEKSPEPPEIALGQRSSVLRVASAVLRLPSARRLVAGLVASALFLCLLGAGAPLLAAHLADSAVAGRQLIDVMAAGTAGLALALAGLVFLRSLLLAYFVPRCAALITSRQIFEALSWPAVLLDPEAGDRPTRRLLARIYRALAARGVALAVDGTWALVALVALPLVAPRLAAVVLAAAALHGILFIGGKAGRARQLRREASAGGQPSAVAADLLLALHKPLAGAAWRPAALTALRVGVLLAVAWMGAHAVLRQQLSPGGLLAVMALSAQAVWPLAACVASIRRLGSAAARIDVLARALEGPSQPDR